MKHYATRCVGVYRLRYCHFAELEFQALRVHSICRTDVVKGSADGLDVIGAAVGLLPDPYGVIGLSAVTTGVARLSRSTPVTIVSSL